MLVEPMPGALAALYLQKETGEPVQKLAGKWVGQKAESGQNLAVLPEAKVHQVQEPAKVAAEEVENCWNESVNREEPDLVSDLMSGKVNRAEEPVVVQVVAELHRGEFRMFPY